MTNSMKSAEIRRCADMTTTITTAVIWCWATSNSVYRYKKMFSLVFFYDIGRAWDSGKIRNGQEVIYGDDDWGTSPGVGIRLNTPLGNLRLDYANGERTDSVLALENCSSSRRKSYISIVAAILIAATFLLVPGKAWAVSIEAEGLKEWQKELALQTLTAVAESIPQSGSSRIARRFCRLSRAGFFPVTL